MNGQEKIKAMITSSNPDSGDSYYWDADEKEFDFDSFKKDAIEYCRLTGHKKASNAFDYACLVSDGMGPYAVVDALIQISKLMVDCDDNSD